MGFLEVQALTNFPQLGAGRTLMLHAHALGFTDEPDFDVEDAAARAGAAAGLKNLLGAPTVKIMRLTQLGSAFRRAAYLFKLLIRGGYLASNPHTVSGRSLHETDVDSTLAVRLLEALSSLNYHEATWSTGRGNLLKTPWLHDLEQWHRAQRVTALDHHRLQAAYAAFWRASGCTVERHPVDFRRDRQIAADSAWAAAADEGLRTLIHSEARR